MTLTQQLTLLAVREGCDLLIGQVEHAALEKAESSLGDLIQAASEDHCRLEGNLIVAELSAEQFSKLTTELKKANALEILSEPRVTTPASPASRH